MGNFSEKMKELGGECYRIIDAEYDTAQKLL